MSLKRRNIIAWLLLLVAAVSWPFGRRMLQSEYGQVFDTTAVAAMGSTVSAADVYYTMEPTTCATVENWTEPAEVTVGITSTAQSQSYTDLVPTPGRGSKFLGYVLCLLALTAAAFGIFFLRQKAPLLGPDGAGLLCAICLLAFYAFADSAYIMWSRWYDFGMTAASILAVFVFLIIIRELWGWILARVSMSWCAVSRISKGCPTPQLSMLTFVLWILLALVFTAYSVVYYRHYSLYWISGCGFGVNAILGFACLWKYGADLNHFKKQLSNYQQGLPITVGDGAFSQTEAQLLDVQAKHEEAVRTAVTSERFKVELISNVSHDLRTPLTSILGYGELLQKEDLSDTGKEQLSRLNQKAGYMRDLVDSLFELTKVSSGVIESKREQIDLIRLLEQTVGLFDDQLTAAGLEVRRHYESNTAPVITDGARMHQVFANLLGNAIKYALTGTRIHLEVKEKEDAWHIRMINTASYEMDFAPEEIMQRFARGDKARTTRGSGLGLAIAQTDTQSVGGTFTVAVDGDQFSAIVILPKN